MVNSDEQQSLGGGRGDGADRPDQVSSSGDSSSASSSALESSAVADRSVTRRLRDIFSGDGDADLLIQRSDSGDGFLRWLRALDMQAIGACRADERLKPLLKLNLSAAAADEDGLLAHLSQHFEPPEVCMLARCLCIPLVSVRVGKIEKRGTVLCPTSIRGNLCLMLLPNSDMRISFIGDDGSVERLVTQGSEESDEVEIQVMSADPSGRSFLMRFSGAVFYYWCSEKSKLLGEELLSKMKDLLKKKPSLADLTRISKSRIDCFETQIRSYLADGAPRRRVPPQSSSSSSSLGCQKSGGLLRLRQSGGGGAGSQASCNKSNLSRPRPMSSFKENHLPKSISAAARALSGSKLKQQQQQNQRYLSLSDVASVAFRPKDKLGGDCSDAPNKLAEFPLSPTPESKAVFSPRYCWCPPQPSSSSSPLPPISSLPNFGDVPPVDFPAMMSEPLAVSLLPSSQQMVPKFTPLLTDPIVHIPPMIVGVCSSGPGYIVSAGGGPALGGVPGAASSLIDPKSESMVEKSARETLRMLISGSSQPEPPQQFLEMFRNAPRYDASSSSSNSSSGKKGRGAAYCSTTDVDAEMRSVDGQMKNDDGDGGMD